MRITTNVHDLRKSDGVQPVRQTESNESRKELSETEDFSNSKAEELMSRHGHDTTRVDRHTTGP